MKRKIKAFLSLTLACALSVTAPLSAMASSNPAIDELTKKVERIASLAADKGISDVFCYGFYDLTGDGSKELFVNSGENAVKWQIFRYVPDKGTVKTVKIKNGSRIKSSLSNVNFVKKLSKGKLSVISDAVNGMTKITDYKYKNDILHAVATYTHKDGSKVYRKDGKKIAAAAFNKKLKAVKKLKNVNCNKYNYTAFYKYMEKIYFLPALERAKTDNIFLTSPDFPLQYSAYSVTLQKYDPDTSDYKDVKTLTFKVDTPITDATDKVIGKFDLSTMELLPSEKCYYCAFEYAEDFIAKTMIDADDAGKILEGFSIPNDGKKYVINGRYTLPEGGYLAKAEFSYSESGSDKEIPIARYIFSPTEIL